MENIMKSGRGRGHPARGYRMTKSRKAALASGLHLDAAGNILGGKVEFTPEPETQETDAEIEVKLSERFGILKLLAKAAAEGQAKALIISGPAGLSKSYTVEKVLEEWDPSETRYRIVKGFVKATGLYKTLFQNKEEGQVLVFDDADSIFFDDTSLNFLKAALDSTERRRISYLSEYKIVDEETATVIPSTFEYNGTCIFITNYDFDALIAKNHKLSPHMQALVSRAHYVDLAMKTRRDYMIRIKQVVGEGLFDGKNMSPAQIKETVQFIEDNIERVRELSLRTALKVGMIRKFNQDWEKVARVTCLRNN
jgi:hypothetical protein